MFPEKSNRIFYTNDWPSSNYPAQDFHVLVNKNNPTLSPWYKLEEMTELRTPEWTFSPVVVRRFSK